MARKIKTGGTDPVMQGRLSRATAPAESEQKAVYKPLSFRATDEQKKQWGAYCVVTNQKMQNLIEAAVTEYVSRHRLDEKQKAAYDSIVGL